MAISSPNNAIPALMMTDVRPDQQSSRSDFIEWSTIGSDKTEVVEDDLKAPKPSTTDIDTCFVVDIEQQNRDFPRGNAKLSKLRHVYLSVYRRLFSLVVLVNIIAFVLVMLTQRNVLSLINGAASNLLVCGLARQPLVVNALFRLSYSIPRAAPYRLRILASKVFHYGGVHSGSGVASLIWYVAFVGLLTHEYLVDSTPKATAVLVLAYFILLFMTGIIIAAHPDLRRRYHDYFELTHRFSGWLLVALFWALLLTFASEQKSSMDDFLVHQPSFWMLVIISAAILQPWTSLRKVKVKAEGLSDHAMRLHFDYATPKFGQGISIARHPLKDFHSFAAFPDKFDTPETKFSVVVSNAGDFTKDVILRPPTHVWKRAIPTHGYGTVMKVFRKIVLVATGSGIGPCLSFLGDDYRPAMRVVWITRTPETTFGNRLLDLVRRLDPDTIIWNTDQKGRLKDKLPLVLKAYQDFQAEAVCIISNPSVTKDLVTQLEQRGVCASGPIFDS